MSPCLSGVVSIDLVGVLGVGRRSGVPPRSIVRLATKTKMAPAMSLASVQIATPLGRFENHMRIRNKNRKLGDVSLY